MGVLKPGWTVNWPDLPAPFSKGANSGGKSIVGAKMSQLHPPPVSVLDQVVDLPLAGSHQLVVTLPPRGRSGFQNSAASSNSSLPIMSGVMGKCCSYQREADLRWMPLCLPLEIGLVSEWVDVHPGELQLGELVDQNPKIGHSPGFTAGSEILEGGMGSNPEDRFHQHVQIGDLEFLASLLRQRVPVGEVADAPALHQLVDGPQRRPRTAASHHQRRRSFPPGPLQHQALIR